MAWGPHVSATGLPSQHVDPVNRSTGGPWAHQSVAQVVPRGCQVGTRRRRAGANSGDQNNVGPSPELAGTVLRGSVSGARGCVRTVTRPRVEWWWWHRRTWPETLPATRSAAEQLRSTVEKMLRRATAQAKGLGGSSSPPGVRYGDLTEQEELGISCAAAMADGGAGAYGQLARKG